MRLGALRHNDMARELAAFWVATISHFLELDTDLEALRSGRIAGLIEDEIDALWSQVCVAVDSLVTLLTAWGSSGGSSCT
jgi:hypothetical protein